MFSVQNIGFNVMILSMFLWDPSLRSSLLISRRQTNFAKTNQPSVIAHIGIYYYVIMKECLFLTNLESRHSKFEEISG